MFATATENQAPRKEARLNPTNVTRVHGVSQLLVEQEIEERLKQRVRELIDQRTRKLIDREVQSFLGGGQTTSSTSKNRPIETPGRTVELHPRSITETSDLTDLSLVDDQAVELPSTMVEE